MVFISKDKLNKKLNQAFKDGREDALDDARIECKELRIKNIELKDKLDIQDAELSVLKSSREESLKLVQVQLENEFKDVKIKAVEKNQSDKAKELAERAKMLDSEEEKNYVKGYADGVSDGLRKIHEMTEKDRDNMAKIAMVAAASHTSIDNMKEINNEFRLTEGSTDPKAK